MGAWEPLEGELEVKRAAMLGKALAVVDGMSHREAGPERRAALTLWCIMDWSNAEALACRDSLERAAWEALSRVVHSAVLLIPGAAEAYLDLEESRGKHGCQ